MKRYPLSDYLAKYKITQAELGRRFGLTQGGISHMTRGGRDIYVVCERGEPVRLEESKLLREIA